VMLSVAGDAGLGVPDTSRIRAQAPPSTSGLAFDASSVKANKSGSPTGDDRVIPGGRYTATNLSLQVLIRFAYERSPRSRGLEPFEVAGGPDWGRVRSLRCERHRRS
jgi:hypothetical protein